MEVSHADHSLRMGGEKGSGDIAKIGWLCFPISRVDTWLLTNGHSVTIPKIAK